MFTQCRIQWLDGWMEDGQMDGWVDINICQKRDSP